MLKYCVVGRFVYELIKFNPKSSEWIGSLVYDVWDDYYQGTEQSFTMCEVDMFFSEKSAAIDFCFNITHYPNEE